MASEEAKVFDLQAFLSGRTYPETTVPVMVDEKLQMAYAELSKAHDEASRSIDSVEAKKLEKSRDKMLKSFKDLILKVTVRQIPQHVATSILDEVIEEFPSKTNMFGETTLSNEGARELNTRTWAAHIVKMEAPDGSFSVPGLEDVRSLQGTLPESSLNAIRDAIDKLTEGAKSGYETSVTELGFLSTP